mmetsp:Transcript_22401/g.55526  ORF Transcript_22401/g.55526 Transcript_22401/m.55526 type:complete len:101 (+) Transcript_22401:1292-1594(+)
MTNNNENGVPNLHVMFHRKFNRTIALWRGRNKLERTDLISMHVKNVCLSVDLVSITTDNKNVAAAAAAAASGVAVVATEVAAAGVVVAVVVAQQLPAQRL